MAKVSADLLDIRFYVDVHRGEEAFEALLKEGVPADDITVIAAGPWATRSLIAAPEIAGNPLLQHGRPRKPLSALAEYLSSRPRHFLSHAWAVGPLLKVHPTYHPATDLATVLQDGGIPGNEAHSLQSRLQETGGVWLAAPRGDFDR